MMVFRPGVRCAACVLLVLVVVLHDVRPALGYLLFGVNGANGEPVRLKWGSTPVRYFVSNRGVPGVNPAQLHSAVARAFSTWEAVPTSSITYAFVGFTDAPPDDPDGMTTLGFLPMPALDQVLAATSFLVDEVTGELLESDIFFNSAFSWSVASDGQSNRFDLESIALHEIGHLSGLGHSALGETELGPNGRRVIASEAVMFPVAFSPGSIAGRALRADDIAAISDLYPTGAFDRGTGTISGTVTKNGQGAFGAHVVAFDLSRGALVGSFALGARGGFSIGGLLPGPHVLRVEPLDDADIESFFDPDTLVDVDFQPAFFDRLVVVPGGGSSAPVDIAVRPK
jgi:hypothetical protein